MDSKLEALHISTLEENRVKMADPVPSLLGLAALEENREKIRLQHRAAVATRIMAGLAANPSVTDNNTGKDIARISVGWADALEIELGQS